MIRMAPLKNRKAAKTSCSSGIEELALLAHDRELITPEIYTHNDFYGHASILKTYCGMPEKYPIKASIEHGMFFSEFIYRTELELDFPVMMVMSRLRLPVLSRNTKKTLFVTGPMMQYADSVLSNAAFQREKGRLGRTLLLFPSHSTHHVTSEFDIHLLCREIEKRAQGFQSVRVCLYWKDVLLGRAKPYQEHGFECTTAGHMYDKLFLPRLRSIIELADVTASNACGGQLGYCVGLGKPHVLLQIEKPRHAAPVNVLKRDVNSTLATNLHYRHIMDLFSHWSEDLNAEQRETVADYWGFNCRRTPDELKTMLQIAEDMYRNRSRLIQSGESMSNSQARHYSGTGNQDYAGFLRKQSQLIDQSLIQEKAESVIHDIAV
jgi:hypothetical protein